MRCDEAPCIHSDVLLQAGPSASDKKLTKSQKRARAAQRVEEAAAIAEAKRKAKKAKVCSPLDRRTCPSLIVSTQYDPDTPRTVLEIQAARLAAAEAVEAQQAKASTSSSKAKAKHQRMAVVEAADDDDDAEEIQVNGFHDPAGDDEEEDSPNEDGFADDDDDDDMNTMPLPLQQASTASQPSIDDIRARLHAKIAEAAGHRPQSRLNGSSTANGDDEGNEDNSVAGSEATNRDALLEERRKKRGEMRDRRRNERKQQRRKEKEQGISSGNKGKAGFDTVSQNVMTTGGESRPGAMSETKKALKKAGKRKAAVLEDGNDGGDNDVVDKSRALVKSDSAKQTSDAKAPSKATNGASDTSTALAFSPLDFTPSTAINGPDAHKTSKKQREALAKSNRTAVTSRDPSIALNALNKREEFLSKLTPQAKERAEEKDKWERMAMRAEGTKVYDDETKLKKMVKRKEKAKAKSSKDWADRKESLSNNQAAAAKKREQNIAERLQQRKDKKLGIKPGKSVGKGNPKKVKKGRPGFEGRGTVRK